MIERVRVRGYRSLHDVDVRLEPLTVLIGRSGTGKSNFVRALRLLRDILSTPDKYGEINHRDEFVGLFNSVYAAGPFGGTDLDLSFEVEMRFKGLGFSTYHVTFARNLDPTAAVITSERFEVDGEPIFCHENRSWIVRPPVRTQAQPGTICFGKLAGIREATVAYISLTRGLGCYDFTGSVLEDKVALDAGPGYKGSKETGLVVAGRIVDNISELNDWRDVGKSLKALSSRIASLDLVLPERDELRVGYQIGGGTHMVDVAEESEGFRRYLAHLLALYQSPRKESLIFEHPEIGIHPGALGALAAEFRQHVADVRGQVILTTHSPDFLNYFDADAIRVVVNEDGRTLIGKPAADQFEAVRTNLMIPGDLFTLDPARLDRAEPVVRAK